MTKQEQRNFEKLMSASNKLVNTLVEKGSSSIDLEIVEAKGRSLVYHHDETLEACSQYVMSYPSGVLKDH